MVQHNIIKAGTDSQFVALELYNGVSDSWLLRWQGLGEGEVVETIVSPRPTLEGIKAVVLGWHDRQIDEAILSGHRYKDSMVWLSLENQNNYFNAFVLAMLSGGGNLPLTFKFGTTDNPSYHEFRTIEELQGFTLGASNYITQTLAEGWQRKDAIEWSIYEEALKAYE
ncbi:MAG: hypothetical protein SPK09_02630 [Porphyromonas sp.]|nr:hypothetical protein [Porphyromonas sp.]